VRVAATLALLLLLVLPAEAGRPEAERDLAAALDFLAREAVRDEMAPYLVEAAVAVGLDPAHWPPDEGALHLVEELIAERAGGGFIGLLRPYHALAVAGHLSAERVEELLRHHRAGQFGDPGQLNDDAWAILTLRAAGLPATDARLQSAADHLLTHQTEAGGWSWNVLGAPDADDTGMVMVALASVGRLGQEEAQRALAFLADQTHDDGGVAVARPAVGNCNSTVWALRGQQAAGSAQNPASWAFLSSLRRDDGAYRFQASGNPALLCTAEVATLLGDAIVRGWDLSAYASSKAAPLDSPLLCIVLCALLGYGRKTL
jgi:hypothetical protein